jgi:hydrogenase maturation protease
MRRGRRPLVIGVGNPDRADDSAGLLVSRDVRRVAAGSVRVLELEGDPLNLLELWREVDLAIVADATRSGAAAGTIHCIDATLDPVPPSFAAASTHALGVAEAIELGRVLGRLPRRLLIYGIEAASLRTGFTPSPAVRAAIPQVARQIIAKASPWQAAQGGAAGQE